MLVVDRSGTMPLNALSPCRRERREFQKISRLLVQGQQVFDAATERSI
jgi:hypothetical protein